MTTPEDSDAVLRAAFAREDRCLAEQPFLRDTLRRVVAERSRRSWLRRALQIAALVGVIALSPWLIMASVFVSAKLDTLFALVGDRLDSPVGLAVSLVSMLLAAVLLRRRGML